MGFRPEGDVTGETRCPVSSSFWRARQTRTCGLCLRGQRSARGRRSDLCAVIKRSRATRVLSTTEHAPTLTWPPGR